MVHLGHDDGAGEGTLYPTVLTHPRSIPLHHLTTLLLHADAPARPSERDSILPASR